MPSLCRQSSGKEFKEEGGCGGRVGIDDSRGRTSSLSSRRGERLAEVPGLGVDSLVAIYFPVQQSVVKGFNLLSLDFTGKPRHHNESTTITHRLRSFWIV